MNGQAVPRGEVADLGRRHALHVERAVVGHVDRGAGPAQRGGEIGRYRSDQPDPAAFWPLYPLLVGLGHLLSGWSVQLVGVVLSHLAFLPALVLLHRLVRLDFGAAAAGRTVWLVALFPTAFFFSAVYTESLFLFLTVKS